MTIKTILIWIFIYTVVAGLPLAVILGAMT